VPGKRWGRGRTRREVERGDERKREYFLLLCVSFVSSVESNVLRKNLDIKQNCIISLISYLRKYLVLHFFNDIGPGLDGSTEQTNSVKCICFGK
jgi:hypothetical protein